jgi:23S rRNA pseudouridine2605 synthase
MSCVSWINLAEGVHVANLLGVTGQEVRLSVQEGKYRMVRRMLANCGHPVVTLHRLKYGMVALGDLPEGEFREIFEDEPEAVWATKLLK